MERRPHGVPAPPNEVQVEAEVLSARPDPAAPQRWQLKIRIRSSERIAGPNFAHPGETYRATYNQPLPDHLSSVVAETAEADGEPHSEPRVEPDTAAEPRVSDGGPGAAGGPPPPPPPDLEQPETHLTDEPTAAEDPADAEDVGTASDRPIMRARCEFMGDERGGAFHIMSIDEPSADDLGGPDPV